MITSYVSHNLMKTISLVVGVVIKGKCGRETCSYKIGHIAIHYDEHASKILMQANVIFVGRAMFFY